MKGTMSEAELHILKQRMHQGRLSKAQRGDLQFALPIGYIWSPTGEIQFDPDEQVQQVVRLVFRTFDELGTLGGLVRYLAQHQIQLGVRVREGPGKGELVWRRPNRATLQMMLKHPLYAGSYVYGRRQEDPRRKQPERPRAGRVVMTMDEWLVLLPNHCPAYISPEQYERNQARLRANRARADAMGAARAGAALLAGLVACARCGCRLTVHYDDGGARLHTYECVERWTHYGEPKCQHLAGPCLDSFVRKPGSCRLGASRLGVVAHCYRTGGAGACRVGSALATTAADRKEIIRQVVERVIIDVQGSSERVKVCIEWIGGGHTEGVVIRPVGKLSELSTYPQICQLVQELTEAGWAATAIAQ